jgi:NADH-quinone oxidoreductase subunit M
MTDHLLTLILFLPTITALLLLFFPARWTAFFRWTAFIASLVPFVFTMVLWSRFDPTATGFQFIERVDWYAVLRSTYVVGVDGISLPMIILTTLLIPLAILASFSIKERVKAFMILFLLLETGMLGVFMTLDLLMFFVFWEVGLVPMYFLIAQWGSSNRNYASLKFILYTMGGSLGLLLAIQMIGVVTGTFDMQTLFTTWPTAKATFLGLNTQTIKDIAFWAFVLAFAVKVPIWPFHTWLPDAHTEAPTGGSMILAGVLLKLGAYGFLRLVLPLYPVESARFAWILAALAVVAIILGALSAWGQTDFKRLVAYSSINHMGFVVLGIAAAAWAANIKDTTNATIAINGAVLQMFNHGLSAAGMFFLVGVIYERTHTRNLTEYGGLYARLPIYGSILIFTAMGSLGLPGLGGFVSEFLVVRGAWPIFTLDTALAMIGLFFTGAYVLKALKLVLHGPVNKRWQGTIAEISAREIVVIAPLMILMLAIGLWPTFILDMINRAAMLLY